MKYKRFKTISFVTSLCGFALIFSSSNVHAECLGQMVGDYTVTSVGDSTTKYHLKAQQIMPDIRPAFGKNGKPTYYQSRDIGPIPAGKMKLKNCHVVSHKKQGLWDSGYELVEDTHSAQNNQNLDSSDKVPGEYLKTENLSER